MATGKKLAAIPVVHHVVDMIGLYIKNYVSYATSVTDSCHARFLRVNMEAYKNQNPNYTETFTKKVRRIIVAVVQRCDRICELNIDLLRCGDSFHLSFFLSVLWTDSFSSDYECECRSRSRFCSNVLLGVNKQWGIYQISWFSALTNNKQAAQNSRYATSFKH